MVPRRGLEPPRLSALVPETSASTNSATWARGTDKGGPSGLSTGRRALTQASASPSGAYTGWNRSCIGGQAAPPHHRIRSRRHDRDPPRHAGHGVRRLGLPRPPRGAGAGQARLPRPRRGAPARACRPSAAARPRRPDPRGAGQSALSGFGRGGRARRRRGDQPGRHPVRARHASASMPCRRLAPRRSRWRRRPRGAAGARLGHRRRPRTRPRTMRARKAMGEKLVLAAVPAAVILRPVGGVRPGGRFLQQVRRHRPLRAGAAADRRRTYAVPAGVRGRRRQRGRAPPSRGAPRPARSTSSADRRCRASSS